MAITVIEGAMPTRKWHQKRLEALENFVEAKR
jgi:hypothetical protein